MRHIHSCSYLFLVISLTSACKCFKSTFNPFCINDCLAAFGHAFIGRKPAFFPIREGNKLGQPISFLGTYFQACKLPKNQPEGIDICRQPISAPIAYLRGHVARRLNVPSAQIVPIDIFHALHQFLGESKIKHLGMIIPCQSYIIRFQISISK